MSRGGMSAVMVRLLASHSRVASGWKELRNGSGKKEGGKGMRKTRRKGCKGRGKGRGKIREIKKRTVMKNI